MRIKRARFLTTLKRMVPVCRCTFTNAAGHSEAGTMSYHGKRGTMQRINVQICHLQSISEGERTFCLAGSVHWTRLNLPAETIIGAHRDDPMAWRALFGMLLGLFSFARLGRRPGPLPRRPTCYLSHHNSSARAHTRRAHLG